MARDIVDKNDTDLNVSIEMFRRVDETATSEDNEPSQGVLYLNSPLFITVREKDKTFISI